MRAPAAPQKEFYESRPLYVLIYIFWEGVSFEFISFYLFCAQSSIEYK